MTQPDPSTKPTPPQDDPERDASRKDILIYAVGNVEGAIANQFIAVLKNILVVALLVNPMLIGLVLSLKTLWDAVTDPIMAYITDNTRSRWGRRRPYILVGGVSRILLLVFVVLLFPATGIILTNQQLETRNTITQAVKSVDDSHKRVVAVADGAAAGSAGMWREQVDAAVQKARAGLDLARNALPVAEADLALKERQEAEHTTTGHHDAAVARGIAAAQARTAEARKQVESVRQAIARAERQVLLAEGAQHISSGEALGGDRRTAWEEARTALAAEMDAKAQAAADQPASASTQPGMWQKIISGFDAFNDPANAGQRTIIIYVALALLLFTTLTTIQSVPYYALGIEMCPSYNGRTRVVTYRAMVDKIAGLVAPWVPWFCFLTIFTTALDGLFWVAVFACVIGIPTTIWMCIAVQERHQVSASKPRGGGLGFWRSMWVTARNRHFLKVFFIYTALGLSNGIFQQIGFYLNVYWVMGSALEGAKLGAWVAMLAWVLGFLALPVMNWACARFGKHRVLRFSIVWMAIGCCLKWWCMDPDHPEYQFILPFFFSVGIATVYSVLGSMMADVTDMDELETGSRREGMFGAMMAFLNKMVGTLVPLLAGVVLVISGFDQNLEYAQSPQTIFNMRLLYSFIPGAMLLGALLLLIRYPLTQERMAEVKAELKRRREAAAPAP